MRAAIMIPFIALLGTVSAARADEPFAQVKLDAQPGYIVPEAYAEAHKTDLLATLPDPTKVQGFWTPTETNVISAERVFRELIGDAAKDPSLLFPDLAQNTDAASIESLRKEKAELTLIANNYASYQRQYVGLIVDGTKLVLCNYSDGTKVNPATDFVFILKTFADDGTMHFLQCQFDPVAKTCSNVSFVGSWQR